MIKPGNIIDKIKELRVEYHSAILTSYTFDATFFADICLPALRQRGISNVIVFVDANRIDNALAEPTTDRSKFSGYTIVRTPARSGSGVFHPKMAMLIGEKKGELFVGSGNLTYSGHSLNDEVWSQFPFSESDTAMAPLFRDAWNFFKTLVSSTSPVINQLEWMKENSKWIERLDEIAAGKSDAIDMNQRSYRLLFNSHSHSIFDALLNVLPTKIEQLSVVSPFYDLDVRSINKMVDKMNIENVHLLIENGQGRLPQTAPETYLFHDWKTSYTNVSDTRHLHAKLFQFDTTDGTYILAGSANATCNALGLNPLGYNDEASILIHSPFRFDFLSEMGINTKGLSLEKQDIKHCDSVFNQKKNNDQSGIIIHFAQWLDDALLISTVGIGRGILKIHNSDIQEISISDFSKPITGINTAPRFVSIKSEDGKESNICCVFNMDEVEHFNPDKRNAKLRRMMSTMSAFAPELNNLLQYVVWEDEKEDSSVNTIKSAHVRAKKDNIEEEVLSPEFYTNFKTRIKSQMATNPNLMIVDLLSQLFKRTQEENIKRNYYRSEPGEEDPEKRPEIVNADDENPEQKAEKELRQLKLRLKSCLKNLKETMKTRLPDEVFGKDENAIDASLNDFSRITVIAGMMLVHCCNAKIRDRELRELFCSVVGMIPVAMRKGWIYDDPYRTAKMTGMLKDYVRYTLLVLIHMQWSRNERDNAELLMLNTLRMLNLAYPSENSFGLEAITEAEKIIGQLIDDADSHELRRDILSLELLNNAFSSLSEFGKKAKSEQFVPWTELLIGSIIQIPKIGFAQIESRPKNCGDNFAKTTVSNPAYSNYKEYRCGSKVRILPM